MRANRRQVLRGIGLTTVAASAVGTALADDGEEGGDTAGLRAAHASPDAPDVDVYVDGSKVVSGLAFRSVTDYLEVPTGEREVKVTVAGTSNAVFGPAEIELEAEDYTAVARGEVGGETTFTVDLFEDTNGANIGDDEARVRAIHASPDAPGVDVTVNDGALTVFDGVERFTSSGYTVVPADTYDIEIRPDTEDNDGEVKFEAADVTLDGRSTYTAFAVGYLTPDDEPANEPFGLVLEKDAGAPPRGDGEDDEDDEDDEDGDGNNGRGRN